MAVATDLTLGVLLARRELLLRPVTPITRSQLDAPVRWVHGSDLADPTPFLDDGVVMLTTGTQLIGQSPQTDTVPYVDRLVARGVAALGFGTDVARAGVPDELIAACESAHLPLFEVPYATPFIAVSRAHADAVAAQAFARRSWALSAQRAISVAALRPDPLASAVGELARQLGTWAGLLDAGGTLIVPRPHPPAERVAQALEHTAHRLLDKGVHRHTMRTRLTQIAQILQLDLSTFDGRARAWAALRTTSREKAETPPLISPRLGTLDA